MFVPSFCNNEGLIIVEREATKYNSIKRSEPTLILILTASFSVALLQTDTLPCKARKGRKEELIRRWEMQSITRFFMSIFLLYTGPVRLLVFRTTAMRRRTDVAPIELLRESRRRIVWRFLVDRLETGEYAAMCWEKREMRGVVFG